MTKNLDPRWLVTSQLKSAGGDPSLLFEIIENIIERRDWEKLPEGGDTGEPVGSFRRMIEAPPPVGCNLPANKLLKMLEIDHRYEHQDIEVHERMARLRENVGRLLNEELPPISRKGEIGNGRRSNIITSTQRGDNPEYTLRRLKRDNPALAEAVIKGEISANAAAVEAGFRAPKIAVRLDNMESAARTLANKLTPDQLDELIAQLVDYRGQK